MKVSSQQNCLIYIPGLHDQSWRNRLGALLFRWLWKNPNLAVFVFSPRWSSTETYEKKYARLHKVIEVSGQPFAHIFLVGQSAGASLAFNAFCDKKTQITGAVSIDGRLREGLGVFPPLGLVSRGNPSLMQSVLTFERENEPLLTAKERSCLLTLHPLWDEIVPVSTATVPGVCDISMPVITHTLGGIVATIFFSRKIRSFLTHLA